MNHGWLILLLLIPFTSAATIQGSVYDFSFEPEEAIVEINTTPSQRMVAKPSYSFEVPEGNYELTAKKTNEEDSAVETISVKSKGTFTLDMILFPSVDLEDLEVDEPVVDPEEFEFSTPKRSYTDAMILLVALITVFIFHKAHKKKHEMDSDAQKIYNFVSKNKRTTQKEIRKEFPHSEAKISLIIADLEQKGLVKKIKKGRGNIIIKT